MYYRLLLPVLLLPLLPLLPLLLLLPVSVVAITYHLAFWSFFKTICTFNRSCL